MILSWFWCTHPENTNEMRQRRHQMDFFLLKKKMQSTFIWRICDKWYSNWQRLIWLYFRTCIYICIYTFGQHETEDIFGVANSLVIFLIILYKYDSSIVQIGQKEKNRQTKRTNKKKCFRNGICSIAFQNSMPDI